MDSEFYTHAIIKETLLPFIRERFPDGHRFQQDNNPKHRSRMTRNFMDRNGINYPKWPAQSPDLNPIEMVWAQMKAHKNKMEPRTKDELSKCFNDFWSSTMTVELCNKYIDHLYKVVPVVPRMNGATIGDVPNRLFPETSDGKSIKYFEDKITNNESVRARVSCTL